MQNKKFALLALAVLAGACAPESTSSTDLAEETLTREVITTLVALTEAMNAHDPERVFSFYRQDPSFLYLGCTNVLMGWETFAARVGPYYTLNTEVTFEQEVLSVQILSSTVAVAALRGSSTEASALFWTEVLQKDGSGRWLVTYEHESWPGCPVPTGPHMGTEGVEEMAPPPDTGGVAAG